MSSKVSFILVCMLVTCSGYSAAATTNKPQGLNFDSPSVLNLRQWRMSIDGRLLTPNTLDPSIEQGILAAPKLPADPTLFDRFTENFDCGPAPEQCESNRLNASHGVVRRVGKRLEIAVSAGRPAAFVDYVGPLTGNNDHDIFSYFYVGRLRDSGYYRVQETFNDDAPGSFLINARNGKVAFMSEYDDQVSLSPDGLHLALAVREPAVGVRIAALDSTGPRVDLICTGREWDRTISVAFKGWQDADTFDFAVEVDGAAGQKQIALRAVHNANSWHVAPNDTAAFESAGINCMAPS